MGFTMPSTDNTAEIKITLLLFGACREAVGTDEMALSLPQTTTVSQAFDQLKTLYPALQAWTTRMLFAINECYVTGDQELTDGDTLAILPPVSGGSEPSSSDNSTSIICELTREEIDTRQLALRILQPEDGAIVSFDGVTRNHSRGKEVLYLEYESYESMAIKVMQQIAQEALTRWSIDRVALVHRLGRVDIGKTSVAIVVTSAHRKVAFEACHFLIDRLKEIVPIWKREYYQDGAVWVDPQLQ